MTKPRISITIDKKTLDEVDSLIITDFHSAIKRSQMIEILIKEALANRERKSN